MATAVEITTRQKWEELLAQCPQKPLPEHRRKHMRLDAEAGSAALAFERGSQRFLRKGKLLNVSAEGVLVRLQEQVIPETTVLLRLTLTQGEALLVGRVVHCTPTVGAFKVGIVLSFEDQGN